MGGSCPRPFDHIVFWSNHRVGCIEPFIPYALESGEEFEWNYRFAIILSHTESDPIIDKWDLGTHVCMGSSLQMVFYKNKKGKILVKILYNEKETTIPAISPFYDCYYEWDVLRAYLDKKVNQPSASPQVL